MSKERILVVDDEEDLLELVSYNLKKYGYKVDCVTTGEQAFEKIRTSHPELILLDLMLPGIDGLDVCRTLKKDDRTSHIPIIMISARGEEADIVTGLELGADDYITKPFSIKILLARIRAVFRRGKEFDKPNVIIKHNIELNTSSHEIHVKGKLKNLTATEFSILHLLLQRPGWVFTRNQIIRSIKGDDYPVTDRSIDVQIVSLRKKLGSTGTFIKTIRGIGYKIKE